MRMETFRCSSCDVLKTEKGYMAPWEDSRHTEEVLICKECRFLMGTFNYKYVSNHSAMFFDTYEAEKKKNEEARKVLEG